MISNISRFAPAMPWGWAWGRMKHMDGNAAFAPAATQDGTSQSVAQLFAVDRTRTSDLQLQIKTDEGDTVTVTLHAEREATSLRYGYRSQDADGGEAGRIRARSATSTNSVDIAVQGDLNDAERADVREFLQSIESVVQRYMSGRGELPIEQLAAMSGDQFESLAGFSMDASRSQTLTMVAMRLREWTAPTSAGDPDAGQSTTEPVNGTSAPAGDPDGDPTAATVEPVNSAVEPA